MSFHIDSAFCSISFIGSYIVSQVQEGFLQMIFLRADNEAVEKTFLNRLEGEGEGVKTKI